MNVAIIPAKGGSNRLANKNMREINGKPLLWYAIEYAKYYWSLCPDIYVSTDSSEIAAYAKAQGVGVIMRGASLCGDAPLLDVYRHAVVSLGGSYEYVVGIQPDHPGRAFILSQTLQRTQEKDCDLLTTQDFDNKPNGALKIIKVRSLITNKIINTAHYINNCVNIHQEEDLKLAEQEVLDLQSQGYYEQRAENGVDSPHILVLAPTYFMPAVVERVKDNYPNTVFTSALPVASQTQHFNVLVPNPGAPYRIDEAVLKNMPNLKAIITPSTGTNHIDIEYCESRGIKVMGLLDNKEYLNTISASAEYTLALGLSLIRKIPQAVTAVKAGHWRDVEDGLRGVELQGKTVTIVGYGRNGKKLANYLYPLTNKIFTYDKGDSQIDLKRKLCQSDIVFICMGLNKDTQGLVDKSWFDMMKDGVYFINTARGEIVNEDALLAALEGRKVQAAAVDVVCDEVNYKENKLVKYAKGLVRNTKYHDRLIVTPHIAGATIESQEKAMLAVLEIISAHYYGERVISD